MTSDIARRRSAPGRLADRRAGPVGDPAQSSGFWEAIVDGGPG
jgi:hypothetical protein